jgi:hypothetical protein
MGLLRLLDVQFWGPSEFLHWDVNSNQNLRRKSGGNRLEIETLELFTQLRVCRIGKKEIQASRVNDALDDASQISVSNWGGSGD